MLRYPLGAYFLLMVLSENIDENGHPILWMGVFNFLGLACFLLLVWFVSTKKETAGK